MIAAEGPSSPISLQCELLEVSTSGYYDWARRAPSDRALTDAFLTERIKEIHAEARGVYGAPRIHAELRHAHGIRVGKKRVARLMGAAGLSGLITKRRGCTTIRVPGVRVADDLVERQFRPAAPNLLWVADITYLRTWEGWLYLAAVQDAFSRAIVGWAIESHMRAELVVDALQMAVGRRRPEAGLVHHSDQGSQLPLNRSSQRCVGEGTVRMLSDSWVLGLAARTRAGVRRACAGRARRWCAPGLRCLRSLACRPPRCERGIVSRRGARVQAAGARYSLSTSAGVRQSRVFLGRVFRAAATAARSSAPCLARSVPFGKYWRSSPLVFSLVPRCHGLCGSQK